MTHRECEEEKKKDEDERRMKTENNVYNEYQPVMEVSRPDFMGLGLVSQRSRSRLGLEVQRSWSRSTLLYRDHKT